MNYKTLRLILGDQLNHHHSWFSNVDDSVLYVIAELPQEAEYVRHHVQKICAFFASMQSFACELRENGHHVLHLNLDTTAEFQNLNELLLSLVTQYRVETFEYQLPDEYRLQQQMGSLTLTSCQISTIDTEHFLLAREQFSEHFTKGKHVMMEHFYRRMRKRFNILMEGNKPLGGKWNYDANNRNKLKPADVDELPIPLMFENNISEIIARLNRNNVQTIGNVSERLLWPINRNQSLSLLAHFCRVCLPNFGRFQDAMTDQHPSQWSLYHSRLAFSLNSKMLSPLEVINAALSAYENNPEIDISQVEGFVRQIMGWREYIRAVYWTNMPEYAQNNHLSASNALPQFFWSGDTQMNCMQRAIGQSLEYGYAHHIQRLMITGNFCLIAEIEPDQVDEWYLGIYVDALEWVEMPNTRGMALFADGGIVGTKPYAASGAYVHRMSDYCKSCRYDQKRKSGHGSCPLNSLYWRFMVKHRDRLAQNPRVGVIYRSWDAMDVDGQRAVLDAAQIYLNNLNCL
jgi:deoxyribodipyrimidine photolyase-related protein